MKRVLRNSYLGLVPPRVICEVGDGGGWPTSQITRAHFADNPRLAHFADNPRWDLCGLHGVYRYLCQLSVLSVSLGIPPNLSVSLGISWYPSVSLGPPRQLTLYIYIYIGIPPYLSVSLGIYRARALARAIERSSERDRSSERSSERLSERSSE